MATVKRLIDFETARKNVMEILAGKVTTPTAVKVALAMQQATVDAVEVPCRCKECKYWRHYDHLGCTEFVRVCTLAYYMIDENGYCLYGTKMDGGNEDG